MTALPRAPSQNPSTAGSLRTGADYLRSLDDGRAVFVDGERVADVVRASCLPRGRAFDCAALRHRGGAGEPRADDLSVAQDRRAGAARLSDPQDPRRSAGAAAVLGDMGGSDVRPDGPHARPRGGVLLRLRRRAGRVRGRRPAVRRQRGRVLRAYARQPPLRQPTRSFRRRSTAASPRTSRATRRSTPAW